MDPQTPTASAIPDDKRRLTEQEKKNNHIASEQKRRQAIREGFDQIADLTPGMAGQGRSEALVLQAAVVHMRRLMAERSRLVEELKRRGVDTDGFEFDPKTMDIAAEYAAAENNGRV